jgi:polygalacturonase
MMNGQVQQPHLRGREVKTIQVSIQRISVVAATCALALATAASAATTCNVRAYGAKGDGTTKDTAAIQKAIDTCSAKGGGTVLLTAGTYVSAPIMIKSNVTLRLVKDATLLGSPDHKDYPPKVEFHTPDLQPLVGSENATNIAIEGEGTIDGNGESWWKEARERHSGGVLGKDLRPKLIILDHSKNIRIEGITIQNSPMWQLVPYYSDNIVIRNVRVLAPQHSPNTDAIDPFSSSNILIDHVFADVGDDNIAIKSGPINSPGPDSPSKNIKIVDCTFKHGHGLSIGSEIAGGVQNVSAERVSFEGTDNGIRVKSNRDRGNADIGNFHFKDITMKDVKNDIIISEYYPKIAPVGEVEAAPVGRLTPVFHDIVLENVTATGETNAGAIYGLPESPVKNVVLKNVHIESKTPLKIGYADVTAINLTVKASDSAEGIVKLAGADLKTASSH